MRNQAVAQESVRDPAGEEQIGERGERAVRQTTRQSARDGSGHRGAGLARSAHQQPGRPNFYRMPFQIAMT
jgi:hypothetical protein